MLPFTNVIECRSLYVMIYLLISVSCLYKQVYSVNLTSKLPLMCLANWADQCQTDTADHTNMQAGKAYETHEYKWPGYKLQWPGIC